MSPATTTPAATPPIVSPMTAGVWYLLAETTAGVATAVEELVGESETPVMTMMLTAVETCPAEFEAMEVNVSIEDSSEIVAPVVTRTVA